MLLMQAIDRMKAEMNPESSQKEEERAEEKEGEEGEEAESGQTGIKVEYLPLDLSSFQSTIDCVRAFKEKNLPLHILINNAAIAFTPYSEWCSTGVLI